MKKHVFAVFLAFAFLVALSQLDRFTNAGNAVLAVQPQFAELQGATCSDVETMWFETNKARIRYGLPPVALDAEMSCRAWEWALEMRNRVGMVHSSMGFAEIIAEGYSARRVVGNPRREGSGEGGWLSSPGHRAIILTKNYRKMGAAKAGRFTIEIFSTRRGQHPSRCLQKHGLVPSPNSPYQIVQPPGIPGQLPGQPPTRAV